MFAQWSGQQSVPMQPILNICLLCAWQHAMHELILAGAGGQILSHAVSLHVIFPGSGQDQVRNIMMVR